MMLFEIANIANSRPIGKVAGSDPDQSKPLTPNDLLLGRSTAEVPQGPFDHNRSMNKRFVFLQNLITEWWECWYQSVLPSLVPSYKWLHKHRNVQVGGVCLIRYRKDKQATYRLGRVIEVSKGIDGLVRIVVLQFRLFNERKFRTVDRPTHGIAVIISIEEQGVVEAADVGDEPEDLGDAVQDVGGATSSSCCHFLSQNTTLNPYAAKYNPTTQHATQNNIAREKIVNCNYMR